MKILVLLLSAVAVSSAAHLRDGVLFEGVNPDEEWIRNDFKDDKIVKGVYVTPLDHFSPTSNLSLRLNYEVNVEFFKKGGPLFLYTEFNSATFLNMHRFGLMYGLARKLNGALIQAHPRYQGNNYFGNSSLQQELKYMTTDHILADIPYLVNEVKAHLNSTRSHVITFGNGDGGACAVLARKRFPHIIDAAWSSSGEFRSVMAETDFHEDIALQLYEHGGANCTSVISKAFQQIKEVVDAKNNKTLLEMFKISPQDIIDLENPQHVQFFYKILFLVTREALQGRTNSVDAIQKFCTDMNYSENAVESYLHWYHSQHNGDFKPIFSYERLVYIILMVPQWQTSFFFYCTQFGSKRIVTTPNGFKNVFPHVIKEQYYDQWCTDLFGARYNRTLLERASHHYNLQHGGGIQYVSNVVFSEGLMNPFRHIGVSEYDLDTSTYVSTEYQNFAADVNEISDTDTEELKAAKQLIADTLVGYITFDEPDQPGVTDFPEGSGDDPDLREMA